MHEHTLEIISNKTPGDFSSLGKPVLTRSLWGTLFCMQVWRENRPALVVAEGGPAILAFSAFPWTCDFSSPFTHSWVPLDSTPALCPPGKTRRILRLQTVRVSQSHLLLLLYPEVPGWQPVRKPSPQSTPRVPPLQTTTCPVGRDTVQQNPAGTSRPWSPPLH